MPTTSPGSRRRSPVFPPGQGARDWRSVLAETAHWLNTPITAFEHMDWSEVVLWHNEARRLAGAQRR